jgi:hypothetical protein
MYHNVDEFETAITNLAAAHPTIAKRIVLPQLSLELHRTTSCLRKCPSIQGVSSCSLRIGDGCNRWSEHADTGCDGDRSRAPHAV